MNEIVESVIRWLFALQMVFWGLNGFFHWIQIRPAGAVIEKFVQACIETRFIMPTVKLIEIVFGFCLLFGFLVPLSLAIFAPLMFIVTGLHIWHNPRPWSVLVPCTLPYILLLFFHGSILLRLVH